MRKFYIVLLMMGLHFAFISNSLNAQSFIPYTALNSDHEGTTAWETGHVVPYGPIGSPVAYYKLSSIDYLGVDPEAEHALHCVDGVNGFPQFMDSLALYGYDINQLTLKFGEMSLGEDIEGQDWFMVGPVETRFYKDGDFSFMLDGEDLIGGFMPKFKLVIDYNDAGDSNDDEITGLTDYAGVVDESTGSSAAVQSVAAGLLADIGNLGIRFNFTSIQPAIQTQFNYQGHPGSYFEGDHGNIELGVVPLAVLPSSTISEAVNADPTQCLVTDVSVTSTGSGNWLHITHNGEMVASILDSEPLGLITTSFYVNNSGIRETINGIEYLDRNFEITPATQPSGTVRVRFYFPKSEWFDLIGANDGDNNDPTMLDDLVFTKFSSASCADAVNADNGTLHDVIEHGIVTDDAYYADIEVTSFSAFFGHGGAATLLPIELISFRATPKEDYVFLKWVTESELNNKGFELQRRTDGEEFKTIEWLNGAGTTTNQSFYEFFDQNVFAGIDYYYRLKQIDINGAFNYSPIVNAKISGTDEIPTIAIYPSLVSTVLNVGFDEAKMASPTLEIMNSNGQKMKNINISKSEKGRVIDVQELSPGMYFLIVKNNQGTDFVSKKFIKK